MINDFFKYLEQPERLDRESLPKLKQLVELYPSFQTAWLLLLKNLQILDDPEFEQYLEKGAIRIADRRQLFYFLHDGNEHIEQPGDLLAKEYVSSAAYRLSDEKQPVGESLVDLVRSIQQKSKQKEQTKLEADIPNEFVTETLAKIYARQGLHKEAMQAYEKLSLKYPEKNIYFAGQIQELKKLIK